MRRVILESPFGGDVDANIAFARACVRDCMMRGEAPIASHLLFTQPGILDDNDPIERKLGMAAGWVWLPFADALVVYTDRGISKGMHDGMNQAVLLGVRVEIRRLEKQEDQP